MNPQELQQKIAEYFQKLPAEAQEVFSSMQWLEALKNICSKYNLSDTQTETIGTETMLTLLSIIHPQEYVETLKKEINVSEEIFDKMISETNEAIFKDVGPQLEETFYKNNGIEDSSLANIENKLDERFNSLSKETKDAITASNYQTKIYEIGQKNGLTIYQIGLLGKATLDVMLGETLPNKFEDSLLKLDLPKEKIIKIVSEINEQILRKIREELVKNINKTKGETSPLAPLLNKERGWGEVSSSPDKGRQEGLGIETREELLNKIENPNSITNDELRITNLEKEKKNTPSILEQKLSGAFQIPKIETDHTLENITKDNNTVGDKTKLPQIDPYRELPE